MNSQEKTLDRETRWREAVRRGAEILAPAGSFESMKAAVAAGADAVYIGGSKFGARAFADNLDEERMKEAIDYVHLHGRSIYMTVNTLVQCVYRCYYSRQSQLHFYRLYQLHQLHRLYRFYHL